MFKVAELPEYFAKREEGMVVAKLGRFRVSDDATTLTIEDTDKEFPLDVGAYGALAKYLKVPPSYLDKVTPEFRAEILRYEFGRNPDAATTVESLGSDIIAVHSPGKVMLPVSDVVDVVVRMLDPEDNVRRLILNEERLHLDVTTADKSVTFPANPTAPGYHESIAEVGDITEAGFRLLAYPFQVKQPSVAAYAERLVCNNGMCTHEEIGRISLKGRTVDEVIDELERAANLILGQLDGYLEKMAQTRQMHPPGSAEAFAAHLAREAGLPRTVLDVVLDTLSQLDNPSVWDINQAFTAVANQTANYQNMTRLQNIGGHLAFSAEHAIHRCVSCQRPI